jgi:hypothetical protein
MPRVHLRAARAPGSKAKRNAYTAAQKKELCLFARSNPTLHQGDIAEHFSISKEWKTSVDRTWVWQGAEGGQQVGPW